MFSIATLKGAFYVVDPTNAIDDGSFLGDDSLDLSGDRLVSSIACRTNSDAEGAAAIRCAQRTVAPAGGLVSLVQRVVCWATGGAGHIPL